MRQGSMMQKTASLWVLTLAEVAGMSLWFTSSAVLGSLSAETGIGAAAQAALASAVQAGFVLGALVIAFTGLADRFDARRVFAVSAIIAAAATASLLLLPGGQWSGLTILCAVISRGVAGAALAGVYPVGMRLAAAWGVKDRGFLVGLLVGALTLGSALPHLVALGGGSDWRFTVMVTSLVAALGGGAVLSTGLGPHFGRLGRFHPRALSVVWRDSRLRRAYLGYFGHMWELYAMWAWLGVALAAGFAQQMAQTEAAHIAGVTVFVAITAGGAACLIGGRIADRYGKAEVTIAAMGLSATMALATATALALSAPVSVTVVCAVIWGFAVIPDSPQFSAIVADVAPPELTGSLLTLQTALGFLLTALTVQASPTVAAAIGWPATLALLAVGPILGVFAMLQLRLDLRA